jgi:hypothetical protein
MFVISHAQHPQNFLMKNLQEIVSYALKYCMLGHLNSEMQQPMPTSINIGHL